MTYVADAHGIVDPDNVFAPLQAASCTYRIALGPQAVRKVLSLRYAPSRAAPITPLCANAHGFSLHAGVRCAAEQRSELEQLCRYITRPAIAQRAADREPCRAGRARIEDALSRRHATS